MINRTMLCYAAQVSGLDLDKVVPQLVSERKVLTKLNRMEIIYQFINCGEAA